MELSNNDWDLQAVVRSCGSGAAAMYSSPAAGAEPQEQPPPPPPPAPRAEEADSIVVHGRSAAAAEFLLGQPAASLRDLDYLHLEHQLPRAPFSIITPSSSGRQIDQQQEEVFISFPGASTSGQQQQLLHHLQPRTKQKPGRKPGVRTPRPKRSKKSQLKKVVCEVPVADGGVSDLWAWRKYGQKPIKGSPYPRGYYKCSSLKACMARKLVERSPEKPGVLLVTYIADHCHAVPTMLNALAGTTRMPAASPDDDSADVSSSMMTVDGASMETTADDDQNEPSSWQADFDDYPLLDDDFFAPSFDNDDDLDRFFDQDDGGVLERRVSL